MSNKTDLDRVVVRILQTGVEEVVSRKYYERYKNDGVVYIKDYVEPKTAGKTKEA